MITGLQGQWEEDRESLSCVTHRTAKKSRLRPVRGSGDSYKVIAQTSRKRNGFTEVPITHRRCGYGDCGQIGLGITERFVTPVNLLMVFDKIMPTAV